jgi:transcriptional regulator with XRE-family HTH domain
MEQEKIGKFIKKLRKENNLTQKDLAEKYGVTYQAVSKWETGKNIPDISLLKEISKDFNVNIEDLLEGKVTKKTKIIINKKIFIPILILLLIFISLIIYHYHSSHDFFFKTITTSCSNFKITGSIAYNDKKSSIYISSINYCGGNDNTEYKKIECLLYETVNNKESKIASSIYKEKTPMQLEDYLKDVQFHIDTNSNTCKNYKNNSLYLQIKATDSNNKVTLYQIPLTMTSNC